MKALTYTLRLLEPLLAAQPFSGEPNSATSFGFVPGSMIRGALIGAYLRARPFPDSAADSAALLQDSHARQLFFGDDVLFLNLYPVFPGSDRRMLPTPLSWRVAKADLEDEEADIFDFVNDSAPDLDKPRFPGQDFCEINGADVALFTAPREITVHNASENRNEKKSGSSQVFRYEALARDQKLTGIILSENPAFLETLQSLLEQHLVTVGGSHTAGYGLVKLESIGIDEDWAGEYSHQFADGDEICVTLLSDAIVHNNGPSLAAAFAATLGISDAAVVGFQELRPAGGFNRKWGLPLYQTWALKAGSVFKFPANALTADQIASFVEKGVGQRRNEGFGRLAVNWHPHQRYEQFPIDHTPSSIEPALSPVSAEIARKMADSRLRQQLQDNLIKQLNRYGGTLKQILFGLPSNTQLSRVRVAARKALITQNLEPITSHLSSLKLARKSWELHLQNKPLNQWIIDFCRQSEAEFRQFFELTAQLPQIGGQTSQLTPALRTEYQARFIDGLMKLAIELRREETQKQPAGGG